MWISKIAKTFNIKIYLLKVQFCEWFPLYKDDEEENNQSNWTSKLPFLVEKSLQKVVSIIITSLNVFNIFKAVIIEVFNNVFWKICFVDEKEAKLWYKK